MPDDEAIELDVAARLKSLVERVERVIEMKREAAEDQKQILAEAKGMGFDTKIIRRVIKERAADIDVLREEETIMGVYRRALGMPDPAGTDADSDQGEATEPTRKAA